VTTLDSWPCDNYKAPLTCLTAPSSVTGRCDFCRDVATAAIREERAEIASYCRGWAVQCFDKDGPYDPRGAVLWNVAAWIDERAAR
jgi:hypothetical protein